MKRAQLPDVSLRPFEDVEPSALARLFRARSITDPDKLAALVPAGVKPWSFPARHERAEFSFAELRNVPGAPPKLPNPITVRRDPGAERTYPYGIDDVRQYVREFESSNRLVPAPLQLVVCFDPS